MYEIIEDISGKLARQENGPMTEEGGVRNSKRTRQNNKKTGRKVELNDSPEIPYRGKTSKIPHFPWGQTNDTYNSYFSSIPDSNSFFHLTSGSFVKKD